VMGEPDGRAAQRRRYESRRKPQPPAAPDDRTKHHERLPEAAAERCRSCQPTTRTPPMISKVMKAKPPPVLIWIGHLNE